MKCSWRSKQAQTTSYVGGDDDGKVNPTQTQLTMIDHNDLYNIANSLGALAMLTVVAYHFVAVNARHLASQTGENFAGPAAH
ncbi:hypothetical protein B0H21DRAFT_307010 [Amylocystis lapponica]|nr:hypothetical protein B0H21DRAFT_60814 [Amylocystis lapponica]KAH9947899.1 hypothetical protein B0H21DRAFT_307010 [Amylocystis lapponica]